MQAYTESSEFQCGENKLQSCKLTKFLITVGVNYKKEQKLKMSSPMRADQQEILRTMMDEHARQLRVLLRELVLKERTIATLEAENQELRAVSRALETERALAENARERLDGLELRVRILQVSVDDARRAQYQRLMDRE